MIVFFKHQCSYMCDEAIGIVCRRGHCCVIMYSSPFLFLTLLLPLCPLHSSCPSAPSFLISFTMMATSTSMALAYLWDYCCCGPPSPSRCPFRWVLKKSLVSSAGWPSSRRAWSCHPQPAPLCCPERCRSASWTRALNVHTHQTSERCLG